MKGISDNVPLVKVVVPKNQSHSFITQGSPDTMVSHDFVLGFSGFRKESRKGEEEWLISGSDAFVVFMLSAGNGESELLGGDPWVAAL